ncbi:MAG: intradiol ring-cleavage dioxygenase [Verrucomicrobiales bacterium]|nr:intradiol ring-cleavage dioxygenase [Verrucomicrobiales bacterium]
MNSFHIPSSRRRLLKSFLAGAGGILAGDIYAEALTLTPWQTEGPYFPDHLPLDQDNDLTKIIGGTAPAGGVITEFGGRLLDLDGKPVTDAAVELWQADNNGCYIHSRGVQKGKERDPLFQGYGKIATNEKGEYRFRTIKPGLYTGRTRHYHIAVVRGKERLLTTQLYHAGEPQNDRDRVLNHIKDEEQRLSVIRPFTESGSGKGELVATWDIVLGMTPPDPEERRGRRMGPPPGGRPPRDGAPPRNE